MADARLTWLGHSTVLLELDGVRLLTDPMLRRRVLHLRRLVSAPAETPAALDGVLLSHAHWDHLDLPSLEQVAPATKVLCPRGLGPLLHRRGFEEVVELEPEQACRIDGVSVEATHAEHPAGRGPFQAKSPALGYVLDGSRRIYFAGDTGPFDGMAAFAPLDLALLPVAGWGRKLGPGHLDPEQAAGALALLRPRLAVPIHWGTYAPLLGRRPADRRPALEFASRAAELAPEVQVTVLEPGGALEL